MKNIFKVTMAGLVTASALLASACHTVEGVGKDLESAGDTAEDVANDVAN